MPYLVKRTGFEPVSAETDINLDFIKSKLIFFTDFFIPFFIQNVFKLKKNIQRL